VNVVVDTSVWSLALRRRKPAQAPAAEELAHLVQEGRVVMLGPVRQELLSGISEPQSYQVLLSHLKAFPDLPLEEEDYEQAAAFFNRCRAKGVQGSNTDFLICAVAYRRRLGILTTDTDFTRYAGHLTLHLHAPRVGR
jgi:predicted nucleic acid-binding protein